MAVDGVGALAEGLEVCLQSGNFFLQAFDVAQAALGVGVEVRAIVIQFAVQIFDVLF